MTCSHGGVSIAYVAFKEIYHAWASSYLILTIKNFYYYSLVIE